jgi:deoxyribodipyrimidine photo-lyase
VQFGAPVLPLFILEPNYYQLPDVSRRHGIFLADCLHSVHEALRTIGVPLCVRVGEACTVLSALRDQIGPFMLHAHEETGNAWTFARDMAVHAWCRENGVAFHEYPSHGVVRRLKSRDHWARIRNERMQEPRLSAPQSLIALDIPSDPLPGRKDLIFGAPVPDVQRGGREEGVRTLQSFLQSRATGYLATLSKPGVSARHCARLSPHIAYGTLSVREIEQATKKRLAHLENEEKPFFERNLTAFLSRLAWRCHFVQKLEQQPDMEFACLHPAFEGMREPHFREDFFEAWCHGRTGYPLVDACMRSLHANGWITFRMRAFVVSFASYHLWLDWRKTGPYLAQLFTDYEPGIHYAQLQMQSGTTGMNAVRMYSPTKQALDHDPQGVFIKRFVPELRDVPLSWLFEPWRMPTPPSDYPAPIVDHAEALAFARAEIKKRWQMPEFREVSQKIHQKIGSRRTKRERREQDGARGTSVQQLTLDV